MAVVRYEAKAKNGTYKDRNGEEKTRWHNMGVCFQSDQEHLSIKCDSLPLNWDGWISLFEPKPKEAGAGNKPTNAGAGAGGIPDDDIPF